MIWGFWCGIVLATGLVLGLILSWRTRSTLLSLSAQFPTEEVCSDGSFAPQSLVINGLILPGCIFLERKKEGLWLGPSPWLSTLGAAPMLIPWSACSMERQSRRWCTLRVGDVWLSGPSDRLQPVEIEESP